MMSAAWVVLGAGAVLLALSVVFGSWLLLASSVSLLVAAQLLRGLAGE